MSTAIAKKETPALVEAGIEVRNDDDLSLALDKERFAQMQRIATVMSEGSLLPDHLVVRPYWCTISRGPIPPQAYREAAKDLGQEAFNQSLADAKKRTMANCFRVVNQAFRWRMDPFAIVDKTYSVGDGKLAYEGQLVAAVINTRAGLRGRLSYDYKGKAGTDERTIIVSGTFKDEDQPRTVEVRVGAAKTKNEIWKTDPDQKLVYSGSVKWARRWCPEVLMGVLTDDDLERIQMNVVETTAKEVDSEMETEANAVPISLPPVEGVIDNRPEPVDPEELPLPEETIAELRDMANRLGTSWQEVEQEFFKGPAEDYRHPDPEQEARKAEKAIRALAPRGK